MLGLPFVPPERFPMIALAPSRVYYWRLDQDEALAKGGFGSPYVIVDGEPFGDADRNVKHGN